MRLDTDNRQPVTVNIDRAGETGNDAAAFQRADIDASCCLNEGPCSTGTGQEQVQIYWNFRYRLARRFFAFAAFAAVISVMHWVIGGQRNKSAATRSMSYMPCLVR